MMTTHIRLYHHWTQRGTVRYGRWRMYMHTCTVDMYAPVYDTNRATKPPQINYKSTQLYTSEHLARAAYYSVT